VLTIQVWQQELLVFVVLDGRLRGNVMNLQRRRFLRLTAGTALLSAMPRFAGAIDYPVQPITVIVPFAAGGPTDVLGRIVSEHMSRTLGQSLVVEDVVGAGGTIGTTRAMRANPDGYTIQVGQLGTHVAALAFYPNLAYNPEKDFAPIGLIADLAVIVAAKKEIPSNNLKEFASYAKANQGKLNMGHAGVGSITHFSGLLFNSLIGVKPVMVPYTGTALATNALIAGYVDYMTGLAPDVIPQAQAGTIKAFAVSSPERNPALPNVPTSAEAGMPEFQVSAWFALFAPKGTPNPILDRLSEALDRALDDEAVRKRIIGIGCEVPEKAKRGRQALTTLLKKEIARWVPVIKAANR
jgi:tripartite-type tricarboxylate transporter receptor subunit TctC